MGGTVRFSVSGVTDSGGESCIGGIAPVQPSFTWLITGPGTNANGTGPTAEAPVNQPGDYACTFTATASRACAPPPLTIGPQTATAVALNLEYVGVTEANEENPGGFLCVNDDDDNNNGALDKDEPGATMGEDDLHAMSLNAGNLDASVTVTLSAVSGGSKIKVYENPDRTMPVTLPKPWPGDSVPAIVYVEGIAASASARDVELLLEAMGPSEACEDRIRLSVINVSLSVTTICANLIATNNLYAEEKTSQGGSLVPDYMDLSPIMADGSAIVYDGLIPMSPLVEPSLIGLTDASVVLTKISGSGSVRALAIRANSIAPFDDDWFELPLDANLMPILNQIGSNGGIWAYFLEGVSPGSADLSLTVNVGTHECSVTNLLYIVEFPVVEIRYKTFIAPDVVEVPADFASYDYLKGDNRWFGYAAAPSRSFQSTWVTVNPYTASGKAGPKTQMFGETRGYDDDPDGSDLTPCAHCALSYGDWCLAPGATAECIDTAQAGLGGNVLSITHQRVNQSEVRLDWNLIGFVPCGYQPVTPGIDAHFTVFFRQICNAATLGTMQFKVVGSHDGFPWHEMYVNGILVYQHDPCCTGEDPTSLFGSGEWEYQPRDANDLCHDPLLGQPLQTWQSVPGLAP